MSKKQEISKQVEKLDLIFKDFLNETEAFKIPQALLKTLLSDKKDMFLEKVNAVYDKDTDSLRDYFQLTQASRKDFMQDYTPDPICRIVSELSDEKTRTLDICSGTGSLTTSFIINNNVKDIYCEELSEAAIPFLILNICIRNINGCIQRKDVLTKEVFETYLITPGEKFGNIECVSGGYDNSEKYNTIFSNPPYSLSHKQPENDERCQGFAVPPKSKADYLFVLDALSRLTDTGKAFFILPHGVLFRGSREEKIRTALIDKNLIEAVIGLPAKLFMNTTIPTAIIVINKDKKDNNILIVDASNEFKKDRKFNVLEDDHINKIITTYREKKEIEGYSRLVGLDEIKENDYNLNIPRYVSNFKEEEIDIFEVIDNIIKLNKEIKIAEREFVKSTMFLFSERPQEEQDKIKAYWDSLYLL